MKISLTDLPSREVFPGYVGRFVHGERVTQAHWKIRAGSRVPEHSHPHEQVVNVLEGEFELTVDGQPQSLEAGTVFVVPSGVPHAGLAVTDCELLDVFAPVREDYRF